MGATLPQQMGPANRALYYTDLDYDGYLLELPLALPESEPAPAEPAPCEGDAVPPVAEEAEPD